MAGNQHGGFWTPTAETFAQHQLLHVANFWKLGYPAVFNLKTQAGGKAELSLTFQLPSPSDPLPPPQVVPASVPPSTVWSNGGLKKANQSRLRRRAKRASERAAAEKAAAEQVLGGEVTPENNAEICTSLMKAAEQVIAEEKVDEKSAQMKEVAEKQSTVKNVASVNEVAEVERCSDCVASTSVGSSGADLTVAVPADKVQDQLPPLPLCLYCCHRGSELTTWCTTMGSASVAKGIASVSATVTMNSLSLKSCTGQGDWVAGGQRDLRAGPEPRLLHWRLNGSVIHLAS